ncbi:18421_t:CDS:2 [Funneliformis geosporum]|nr:18421_t:CDS:2 [Funneliformis geosporum]
MQIDIYELPYAEQKLSAIKYFRFGSRYTQTYNELILSSTINMSKNIRALKFCTSERLEDDIAKR